MKGTIPMEKLNLVKKQGYWYVYGDGDPKLFPSEREALEFCLNKGWVCTDKDDYGDFVIYTLIPD